MPHLIAFASFQRLEKVIAYVVAIPKVRHYVRPWYNMLETSNGCFKHIRTHMHMQATSRQTVRD